MTVRVAINGFGRIGRQVLRQISSDHDDLEVVVINSVRAEPDLCAHLFKYDSVFGRYPGVVDHDDDHIIVDGHPIRVSAQPDPLLCPWHAYDVDVVIESTGRFTDRDAAAQHLKAGAAKVIITAPARYDDATIVMGVNDDIYDPDSHDVISAGSCTTNCLGPVLKVLDESYTIVSGLMTTVHAYTRDQELLDGTHSDMRRARAATLNMCPTQTGAAKAIDRILPDLSGKIVGLAVRVPLPDVSLVDLSVRLEKAPKVDAVNQMFSEVAAGALEGILDATEEPLVSSDFHGDHHSAIVDLPSTRRAPGGFVKVLAWYDNETGYSARVIDLLHLVGASLDSEGTTATDARAAAPREDAPAEPQPA
ncbi:MAG: type I glyceraldehyde-3-phosphate dehydrogenase [Actinomycetota bacterium]